MSDIVDISWAQLSLGFLVLIIPAWLFWKFRTGLLKRLGIATVRMTVQLLFVGYYLEYLFELNNPYLNMAWVLIMVFVADLATIDRSELTYKRSLIITLFFSTLIGILLMGFYFLYVVIQLPNILSAQYAIPIIGMIMGNCLRSNVIGINAFYYDLNAHNERYRFYLANGASRQEALNPFFRDAIKKSTNPTLAAMATIGLVSLPGMMTGQILSGSSPLIAIKYQILIMLAILSGSVLSVYLGIFLSNKAVINKFDMLDSTILKED